MSGHLISSRIVLASRPSGRPVSDNFRLEQKVVRDLAEGEVLLQVLYLSLDPYMRGRMDDAKSYAKPVEIGDVMEGGTVARVLRSRNVAFDQDDIVLSHSGWQSHAISNGSDLRKLDPRLAPVTTALGILGMPGFTAYAGLRNIGKPKAGETVVVAAASGAVGSAVGQIAKIFGARAVGIAGGAENAITCAMNSILMPRLTIVRPISPANSQPPARTVSMSISKMSAVTSGVRYSRCSTILPAFRFAD